MQISNKNGGSDVSDYFTFLLIHGSVKSWLEQVVWALELRETDHINNQDNH